MSKRYLSALLLVPVLLSGTEYFCSPSGNDTSSGTRNDPWKTVAAAVSKARRGDVVTLLPGEYQETIEIKNGGITLRGTRGRSGEYLSLIAPAETLTGWTTESAIADGMWSVPLKAAPGCVTVNGRQIILLGQRLMKLTPKQMRVEKLSGKHYAYGKGGVKERTREMIPGLDLLALLVTPCLVLGMYKWLMDLLRGEEHPVSFVFCRMRLFLRAIGLQLLIILKVLLWMLPGIAVMAVLLYPLFQAGNAQAQLEALQRGYNLALPVMLLMIIPGAMAALRYALSEYILAEEPGTKILECIRRSKELMKDQKKNLFFLVFSFLLWYLLEILIASLLSGVLSLVFQMFAGLALNVYMSCSVAAFFLHLACGEKPAAEPEPAPEDLN